MSKSKTEYHVVGSCNKCGEPNKVSCVSSGDGLLHEAMTECTSCGFEDYWGYGYFESEAQMDSKCDKYYR